MSNSILFVFEGEKTEKQISDNLIQYFCSENTVVHCAYCSDIYAFHRQIENDEFLDTFSLLKEKDKNKDVLSNFTSADFAEIYLFFDYDGHVPGASDSRISKMLECFNEETESGKLYISYPMVEALKHYSDSTDFFELTAEISLNTRYKGRVHQECDEGLRNFSNYSLVKWQTLVRAHLKKMNFIVLNDKELPKNTISQISIFEKQIENYITPHSMVSVLSSFPVFLFDYYGTNLYNKLI